MTPQNETDLRKFLTPFADGELDVEQSLRVLEHMAMNPPATKRVMHQQQLRQSIGKYFAEHTPPAPAELQSRLENLFPADAPRVKHTPLWWIISLTSVALGLVLLGGWLGRITTRAQLAKSETSRTASPAPTTSPVPMSVVGQLLRTHVNCGRMTAHNHSKLFSPELANLAKPLEKFLNVAVAPPVLDDLNFHFMGAEPCQISGGPTVHLFYRGNGTAHYDTISIFIQRDRGQLNVPPQGYNASTSHAAHPLFVWRSNGVVYYLIGDNAEVVKHAAKVAGAPA